MLYWSIGETIVEKQKTSGWRSNFVDQLAKDLQNEFPELEGFSRTIVFRMRAFYLKVACAMSLQQFKVLPIFNIPWGHKVILIARLKKNTQRFWYAKKVIELGLSRNMLEEFIKTGVYEIQNEVIVSTRETLSFPSLGIAQSSLIDSWIFWTVLLFAVIIVHNKICRA